MEAVRFSDKPVNVFRTTLHHIPEDYKLASGLYAGMPPEKRLPDEVLRSFPHGFRAIAGIVA
jgi:hypothetical protein